jgi:hypothetical protein
VILVGPSASCLVPVKEGAGRLPVEERDANTPLLNVLNPAW